jgi:hypothetical protein
MRKITIRVLVGLGTLSVGVAATVLWLVVSSPPTGNIEAPTCQWLSLSSNVSNNRFQDDIYFPTGVFSPDQRLDEISARSYSHRLAMFHEPSLDSLMDKDAEVYRFLWLRSFHPAVVIRVWRCGSNHCLSVKQMGERMPDPLGGEMFNDTLTADRQRVLGKEEWNGFMQLIEAAHFSTIPSGNPESIAYDGAWWVMEGYSNQKYHVVERQSPSKGEYYQACVYLIRISGVFTGEQDAELY